MVHNLKTLPCYFQRTWNDEKLFEIRNDRDRSFQKGDKVELFEYDPKIPPVLLEQQKYSGRSIIAEITYVTGYEQKEGFVVFGIDIKEKVNEQRHTCDISGFKAQAQRGE